MDSIEKKDTSAEDNGQNDDAGKVKGKRLRIKDTRKVDYNRATPERRPYHPLYGQPRRSSPQRPYASQD